MGWTMWHVWGQGFDVAKAESENGVDDPLRVFLLNHMKTLGELEDEYDYIKCLVTWMRAHPDEAIDHETICGFSDSGNAAEVISLIMARETGIGFAFPGITDEGEDYVLYTPAMPWEMNDAEKELTEESLRAVMERYANELGVPFEDDVDLVYAG